MISAIPKELIPTVWPTVEPMLQKALEYSDNSHTIEDIKSLLETSAHLLLVAQIDNEIKGAFTLNISEYPQKKILNIVLVGGTNLDEWEEEGLEMINMLAKEMNINSIYSNGRDGWTRKLKKYGYHKIYTVLERAVA